MQVSKPVKIKQKSWGREIWLHNSNKYCGKILVIKANKSSSLHYHKLKDETFYIQEGRILVKIVSKDEQIEELEMSKGDVLDIPKGTKHQIIGIAEESEIFEVSTQHFDDDSIYV
ncbi:cupin domain-containing protein [Arcobacter peruensis]|uniref:cupin domain-containing protein n=1 Tax=Arcobacter peruensis TaxID=2320140 RepID=UPI000F08AA03|nr:cupin domain-containing protein [Arcobacter peruensis]